MHAIAQSCLLVLLYAVPALMALHAAAVGDPDIWWHLRSGEWILQHHSIPQVDPFSAVTAGKSWAAYSWAFELLVLQLFHHFGLTGIMAYTSGMLLAITVALHHLIRRLQPDFSLAVLLTFAACFSFGHIYTPRPWLVSILFFALELNILLQARHTGRVRELAWLPVIFLLWTNMHIQFVDGLVVLALAAAESLVMYWRPEIPSRLRPIWAILTMLVSVAATLCNPYGWRIYQVAHDLAAQPGVLNKLQELQALPFRDFTDWSVLALALAAVAVLARSGNLVSFESALLLFAVFVSFRSQRDVWVLTVAAVAILASRATPSLSAPQQVRASLLPVLAGVSAMAILLCFQMLRCDNEHLQTRLAASLPVHAANFVKAQGFKGPLYNDYGWGGYLMWSLRRPVSIDGRAALYGDERIDRSDATWSGRPGWAADPELRAAQLVLGPTQAPLTQLLRMDKRFQLAYEDKLATVFVRVEP